MCPELVRKIKGKKYMLMSQEKTFFDARKTSRDVHGGFSKKVFVPPDMSFNQLRKNSLADVRIKKNIKGFGVYASPKKKFWFPHVVIMGRKQEE